MVELLLLLIVLGTGLYVLISAFRTAGRQKQMDTKLSSKSSMVSEVFVEKGAGPSSKAEEPDR